MKIISSFMDDLFIQRGEYHTIAFESSYIQSQFRELILSYFHKETQLDHRYIHMLNDREGEIQAKNFFFMSFDCNIVNLQEDKATSKLLYDLLYFHLENNPDLVQEYMKFNEQINEFISRIEVMHGDLAIEFQPSEKTISQFIRSLNISIEYNEGEYVPNYVLRDFLIKSMLKFNIAEKDVFLLISFPETDIGGEDVKNFVELLKDLEVTSLIFTTQPEFLTAASEKNMFLVDKNGGLYDTIKLKQELCAFKLVDKDTSATIAKNLALRDFKKDYLLLNDQLKEFLLSNRL